MVAEDKLFSTLDPVTRRIKLPGEGFFLLTDTVGFIQKLPPSLLAAFRATLEELQEADGILHVVDITHPNAAEQVQVVDDLLNELKLQDKPRIWAMNKMDLLMEEDRIPEHIDLLRVEGSDDPVVAVSAATGWGLDRLLEAVEELTEDLRPESGSAAGFWANHRYEDKENRQ